MTPIGGRLLAFLFRLCLAKLGWLATEQLGGWLSGWDACWWVGLVDWFVVDFVDVGWFIMFIDAFSRQGLQGHRRVWSLVNFDTHRLRPTMRPVRALRNHRMTRTPSRQRWMRGTCHTSVGKATPWRDLELANLELCFIDEVEHTRAISKPMKNYFDHDYIIRMRSQGFVCFSHNSFGLLGRVNPVCFSSYCFLNVSDTYWFGLV